MYRNWNNPLHAVWPQHNKMRTQQPRNSTKYSNTWRLNNAFLQDQWVIKEIRKKIKHFLEFNENESTTFQKLWDTAKAVLRGKFIAMSAYIKNTERSQNDLMMLLKLLEKRKQGKSKTSKRREIIFKKGWNQWNRDWKIHTKNQ
jgi:hypothetical protein